MRLVIALDLGFDYTSAAYADMERFGSANCRIEQINRQQVKNRVHF